MQDKEEYYDKGIDINGIKELVIEGLDTDGSHHKQWILCEIGKLLGINLDEYEDNKGIAP